MDPNINANAQTVSDKLDGEVDGRPLSYDLVDMLAPSERFSLSGTVAGVTAYAYPEGRNTSSSFIDHTNTLAKILTRTYVAKDGNTYDAFDMLTKILDSVVTGA